MKPAIELIANDEVFKTVRIYDEIYDKYLISNYGRLYSLHSNRILKRKIDCNGYIACRLYKDSKEKYTSAHRLVAFAFVDNPQPDKYNIVNHKDENPLNPKWDNLEWTNNEINLNYGTCQKRRAAKRSKTVLQFDLMKNHIATYESLPHASKNIGVSISTIFLRCHDGKPCKEYYFSYA